MRHGIANWAVRLLVGSLFVLATWCILGGCGMYGDISRNPWTTEGDKTSVSKGQTAFQPVGKWTYTGLDGKKHTEIVYRRVEGK